MKTQCYPQTDLSSLWIGTVGVDTRGDAGRGDNRGIVAFIGCQREDVLCRQIDTQALDELTVLGRIIVADGDIVELEVVSVLQEIARDDTTA